MSSLVRNVVSEAGPGGAHSWGCSPVVEPHSVPQYNNNKRNCPECEAWRVFTVPGKSRVFEKCRGSSLGLSLTQCCGGPVTWGQADGVSFWW